MSHDLPAISVNDLSKRYRIGKLQRSSDTLVGTAFDWLRSPLRNLHAIRGLSHFRKDEGSDDALWALRNVTFTVAQGEVVGLVGRNGSGKSTLLKILTRITRPTEGQVTLRGRVASLLEVGTGFHQDLSGRDNVYLNGCVLGMRKGEIDNKFDEIVAFSGVERFIDTPIKRYSSGMKVRLAFAVAAHLEAEILLIDEVLAVGDAEFQRKCLGKMGDVARSGRTVVFVSHSITAVSTLCTRCLHLSDGRLVADGETSAVTRQYLSAFDDTTTDLLSLKDRRGSGVARIATFDLIHDGIRGRTARVGADLVFRIGLKFSKLPCHIPSPRVSLQIFNSDAAFLVELSSHASGQTLPSLVGDGIAECRLSRCPLMPGNYRVTLLVASSHGLIDMIRDVTFEVVGGDYFTTGVHHDTGREGVYLPHSWSWSGAAESSGPSGQQQSFTRDGEPQ